MASPTHRNAASQPPAAAPAPTTVVHSRRPSPTSKDTIISTPESGGSRCWNGFINFFRAIWEGILDLIRKIFGCPKKEEPTPTQGAGGDTAHPAGSAAPRTPTASRSDTKVVTPARVAVASGAAAPQDTRRSARSSPAGTPTPAAPRANSTQTGDTPPPAALHASSAQAGAPPSAAAAVASGAAAPQDTRRSARSSPVAATTPSAALRANGAQAGAPPRAASASIHVVPAPKVHPLGAPVPILISPTPSPAAANGQPPISRDRKGGTPRDPDQPGHGRLTPRDPTPKGADHKALPSAALGGNQHSNSPSLQRLDVQDKFGRLKLVKDSSMKDCYVAADLVALIQEAPNTMMRFVRYDEVLNLLWKHLLTTMPAGSDVEAKKRHVATYLRLHFVTLTPGKIAFDPLHRLELEQILKHTNFSFYPYSKAVQFIKTTQAIREMAFSYSVTWNAYFDAWGNRDLKGFV
jgi:hypothetical protein